MKPGKKQITKKFIENLIKEEAQIIKRKKEIYEAMKSFNKELDELNKKGLGKIGLNERAMVVGAQGFAPIMTTDQNKITENPKAVPTTTTVEQPKTGAQANPTGFVNPQSISHFAELEAEFAPKNIEGVVVLDSPESKSVIDMPLDKAMVDTDVKKQLIDMKEKLEMILSSLSGGEEAAQAESETEKSEEDKEKEEEEDKEDKEDKEEEEEEIVIKEGKKIKKSAVK